MSTLVSVPRVEIPGAVLDAIRSFPIERSVEHCGKRWSVLPFDIYADCPHCGAKIKVRSFSGGAEVEDLFDAVFEWMNQPGAGLVVRERCKALEADEADEA